MKKLFAWVAAVLAGCGQKDFGGPKQLPEQMPRAPDSIAAPGGPAQSERADAQEGAVAAQRPGGSIRERIGREVEEHMQRLGVPGVSLAVINDYAIEWAPGVADSALATQPLPAGICA